MAAINNIYASLFGSPATQAAAKKRDATFQDWLNTRKQAVESQRTDDVKMARYNAFGNLLTTMVQPLGWGIGNKFSGKTGGVQPYDNRQYIEAFNRAVRATDDLRNIGTMEGEYQFKIADENYRRALQLDDEARKRQAALEDAEAAAKIKWDYSELRQEQELEKIAARGDVQRWLAEYKAAHKGTNGTLSFEQRKDLYGEKGYQGYAQTMIKAGKTPMSREEYRQIVEESDSGSGQISRASTNPPSSVASSSSDNAPYIAGSSGSSDVPPYLQNNNQTR